QEPLERGPLHIAAGEATVVVTIGDARPPFGLLAGDIRLGRFALSVERIELLLKPLFRRFARVNRASDRGSRRLASIGCTLHCVASNPKKRYPLQCVPVIFFATAVSDLNRWPSKAKPSCKTCTCSVRPLYLRAIDVPGIGSRGSRATTAAVAVAGMN